MHSYQCKYLHKPPIWMKNLQHASVVCWQNCWHQLENRFVPRKLEVEEVNADQIHSKNQIVGVCHSCASTGITFHQTKHWMSWKTSKTTALTNHLNSDFSCSSILNTQCLAQVVRKHQVLCNYYNHPPINWTS